MFVLRPHSRIKDKLLHRLEQDSAMFDAKLRLLTVITLKYDNAKSRAFTVMTAISPRLKMRTIKRIYKVDP